ncbi:hemolysin-type calcium-binding region, partial [Roseivivax marinus]
STATVTFSGATLSTANMQTLIDGVSYQNTSDDPDTSNRVVTLTSLTDSGSNAGSNDNTAALAIASTVTVAAINDEPTLTATGSDPTFTEGGAAASLFSGTSASTVESGQTLSGFTLTVTNVADGASEILNADGTAVTLTNGTSGTTSTNSISYSVSVSGSTATVTFSGATLSTANMQTLIDGVSYQNTSNDPDTANRVVTLTSLTDSGSNTGSNDNVASLSVATTVAVSAVNDAPVVGNLDGDGDTSIVAGGGQQALTDASDVTVSDVDSSDFNGGVLRIVQTSGTENGSWGLDGVTATSGGDGGIAAGETISVGGVTIGTVDATSDGQGGSGLNIALGAGAIAARIETLFRALTISAPSGLGDRTFSYTLSDGDGSANGGDQDTSGSFTVNVTPNPPVLGGLDGDSVGTPNGVAVAVDAGGNSTVTDADNADFDGGTLTVTRTSTLAGDFSVTGSGSTGVASGSISPAGADGILSGGDSIWVDGIAIGTVNAVSDGQGSNDLVLTLGSLATPARVQQVLRALEFSSSEGGAHGFEITLNDGSAAGATSAPASVTVTVEAAPENTVPGTQTAVDGLGRGVFGLSVADADSATVTTTLSVADGTGVFETGASGAAVVTGSGTATLTVTGTLADVNTTLGNVGYTPTRGTTGLQTVTVTTTDGTNTDIDTFAVDVSTRPILTDLDGDTLTYTEGDGFVAIDTGAAAAVIDPDSASFDGGLVAVTFVDDATASEAIGLLAPVSLPDGAIGGGRVLVDGTEIGTLLAGATGLAGTDLVIEFGPGATPALVSTLLGAIAYANTAEDITGTRRIVVELSDGDAGTANLPVVEVELVPVNDAPSVALTNLVTALPEDTDTTTRIKVADIVVTDDALGTETLSLAGADAGLFEIDGTALYLRAGAALNHESGPRLEIDVLVDDATVGTSPDDKAAFGLDITDVDEAPILQGPVVDDVVESLPEDTDTTSAIRLGTLVVSDDALGTRTVAVTGADADLITFDPLQPAGTWGPGFPDALVGLDLYEVAYYLAPGAALDFETQAELSFSFTVDDPALGGTPDDSIDITVAIADVNEAPSVALANMVTSLPENTDTTSRLKIADIVVTDDALGTEALALTGADADIFEIDGTALYLRAGTTLDFETLDQLDVTVTVDDANLGDGAEDSAGLSLGVTDVNEAPSVALANVVTSLPEDTDTTSRVRVADIMVTDDALGIEVLALTGADAALFEIDGTALYLRAGTTLDFETLDQLDVTVTVDDPTLGDGAEDSAVLSIGVTDVNEAPTVALANVVTSLPENT